MNTWIVIPDIISGLYPRLMPELGKPIRAKKYPQKNYGRRAEIIDISQMTDGGARNCRRAARGKRKIGGEM